MHKTAHFILEAQQYHMCENINLLHKQASCLNVFYVI